MTFITIIVNKGMSATTFSCSKLRSGCRVAQPNGLQRQYVYFFQFSGLVSNIGKQKLSYFDIKFIFISIALRCTSKVQGFYFCS